MLWLPLWSLAIESRGDGGGRGLHDEDGDEVGGRERGIAGSRTIDTARPPPPRSAAAAAAATSDNRGEHGSRCCRCIVLYISMALSDMLANVEGAATSPALSVEELDASIMVTQRRKFTADFSVREGSTGRSWYHRSTTSFSGKRAIGI